MDDTRDRIVEVARTLFLERGYQGTSLRAIAEEVGVSTPALYWHFSSKDELCFEFMRQLIDGQAVDVQTAMDAEDTPAGKLAAYVRRHVRIQLDQQDLAGRYDALYGVGQLLNELRPEFREQLIRAQRAIVDLLEETLRTGVQAGAFEVREVAVTAMAIITMCEYVVAWYKRNGRLSPAEVADEYARLALGMVGAHAPRTEAAGVEHHALKTAD